MLRLLPPIRWWVVSRTFVRSAAVSTTPRGDQGVRFLYISWSWLVANFTVKERLINPPLKLHSLLLVFGKRFFISTFSLIQIPLSWWIRDQNWTLQFMHSAINNLTLASPFFGYWWYQTTSSFIFWPDNCCLTNSASAWAWAPTPEGLRSINKDETWSRSSHRRKIWRHLHTVWVSISRRCDWHKIRFVPVVAVLWWTYVYYVGICIYF